MPWQTTIQRQGQTYLGCGVPLNCMWSHSVESNGREKDPNPSLSDSKSQEDHKTRRGYPVDVLQSFPLPHNTYCILYKLVSQGDMNTAY